MIDRTLLLRHWLLPLLGLVWFGLASLAVADEPPDEWGAWNELPDDLLELSADDPGLSLSQRLDQLTRDGQQDALEALLPEQALDRWLGQWSRHGGPDGPQSPQSLDELFQQLPAPARQPGPPINRPSPATGSPDSEADAGQENRPANPIDQSPGRP